MIISGNVYDEAGRPVTGAVVTVNSLDKEVRFSASATTSDGVWLIRDVPEGANIELTATKAGYTKRRRVASLQMVMSKVVINFGSASKTTGEVGSSYFISERPEIEMVEPRPGAKGVDVSTLVCKLRVSEPLDTIGRENFLKALRIWPANKAAAGRGVAETGILDCVALNDANEHDGTMEVEFDAVTAGAQNLDDAVGTGPTNQAGYVLREGTSFPDGSTNRAKGAWNDAGTELTFTFDVPLLAPNDADAKYQIGLVSGGTTPLHRIKDLAGNQLGTGGWQASWSSYPDAGRLIANAFREVDLDAEGDTAERRWASTHDSVVNFEAKRDEVVPQLLGLAVADDVGGHTRLAMTFSEALVAFDGTEMGFAADSLLSQRQRRPDGSPEAALLANFTFALGRKPDDTRGVLLDGFSGDELVVDPLAVSAFGSAPDDFQREFRFAGDSLAAATGLATTISDVRVAAAPRGSVFLQVNPMERSTLFLWILGRPHFFPPEVQEFKVFVSKAADPAGNALSLAAGSRAVTFGGR